MKICKVIIPFIDKVTGEPYKENDEIRLSDERIAEIRTVNPNMVYVIGEAPVEEDTPEEPVEPTEPEEPENVEPVEPDKEEEPEENVEPAEEPVEPAEKPKKPRAAKNK